METLARNESRGTLEMKNICRYTVGIVGGMGSYATVHFFQKLVDAFPAEKEWERPRVIVDNNCLMPSRVRAILYGERRNELIEMLANSIRCLLLYKVDRIVLACNTAHHFLPEIRRRVDLADHVLVDLIRVVIERCRASSISEILVLATEGTMATKIYDDYCREYGIKVNYPQPEDGSILRGFIEDVKQRRWASLRERFGTYLANRPGRNIVVGCTELSVIYDAIDQKHVVDKAVLDPVQLAIDAIHQDALGKQQSGSV